MAFHPFTPTQVTHALMTVIAWGGNIDAAAKDLEAQGDIGPSGRTPSVGTLREWMRDKHAEQYDQLREQFAEQQEKELVERYRASARRAVDVADKGMEKAMERLESGEDPDPSKTAANAATVADKNTRDMLALSGRPTSIRQDRSLEETLRALHTAGIVKFVGEDEPPAELPAGTLEPTGDGS